MTEAEFSRGWDRLVKQWGKQTYTEERGALFWRNVKDHTLFWWMKTIDKFIGDFRQAPLMPELYEEISLERERNWSNEKREHAEFAKEAMREWLSVEDRTMLAQGIGKRLKGQMSDQDFESFTRMIDLLPKPLTCRRCSGSGYLFVHAEGAPYAYRCPCPAGQRNPRGIPEEK